MKTGAALRRASFLMLRLHGCASVGSVLSVVSRLVSPVVSVPGTAGAMSQDAGRGLGKW